MPMSVSRSMSESMSMSMSVSMCMSMSMSMPMSVSRSRSIPMSMSVSRIDLGSRVCLFLHIGVLVYWCTGGVLFQVEYYIRLTGSVSKLPLPYPFNITTTPYKQSPY